MSIWPLAVIFDFDGTLTKFNTATSINHNGFDTMKLEDLFCDYELFIKTILLLRYLRIPFAIASYGKKEIILNLLERVFSTHYYSVASFFSDQNVITPLDMKLSNWREGSNPPSGMGKHDMIKKIFPEIKSDKILVFEDNLINIIDLTKQDFRCIYVKDLIHTGYSRHLDLIHLSSLLEMSYEDIEFNNVPKQEVIEKYLLFIINFQYKYQERTSSPFTDSESESETDSGSGAKAAAEALSGLII